MTLSITTKIGCSVGCTYCPQQRFVTQYRRRYPEGEALLTTEIFGKCLDNLSLDTLIRFSGYSDPYDNPDCSKLIQLAIEKGFSTEVWSTFKKATLKDIEILEAVPLAFISVHLPCNKGSMPGLTTITEEYKEIIRKLTNLKVKRNFRVLGSDQLHPDLQQMPELQDRVKYDVGIGTRAGNLQIPDELKQYAFKPGHRKSKQGHPLICTHRVDGWFLLPNGEVHACCEDWGLQLPIGSLVENTQQELLVGEKRRKIIEAQRNWRKIGKEFKPFPCQVCNSSVLLKGRNLKDRYLGI